MKRNAVTLVLVILFIALVVFYGSRGARGPAHVNGGSTLSGNIDGKNAPDFELKDLDGKAVKLTDYRGKAVLLNFWATWCGPCKVEMPWFVDLQNQYGPQGLQIVGVAMDDSGIDNIRSFSKQMGVNYPVLIGKEAVGEAYGGVMGLPTTFYIDRLGKVVTSNAGLISKSEIEDDIKKALASSSAPAGSTTATATSNAATTSMVHPRTSVTGTPVQ